MAIIHWKRGIDGQFTDAANWSSNTVPTANDDVAITATGTYTVTVSADVTVKSLTTVSTATLAIAGGDRLTITHGTTGTAASAGTINVADRGALEIAGTFKNNGKILLNSSGHSTGRIIAGNTTLTGSGQVLLSDNVHNSIGGIRSTNPFLPVFTLTNATNTIEGSGTIGANLSLINAARIIGNGTAAALILNTGAHRITNSGVIDAATAMGIAIVSNVLNSGVLAAVGTNANLTINGVVTDAAPSLTSKGGLVEASGSGAHIDLSSAAITGGTLRVDTGGVAETLAGSGSSSLSNLAVTGSGVLEANALTTLSITNSTISTTAALMSNGIGSSLIVDGTVGAVASTIDGGAIEFNGASAANVTFAAGSVGTLKLDATFTGTVSGLAGPVPTGFSNFFAFGDSTIDSGALQFLSPELGNPDFTARLQNALANGGTDAPVGVGQMNTEYLAARFGLSANTAYTTGGVIGGGGTDYAVSGAFDAADNGNGGDDPGNGGRTNSFLAAANPAVLSTVGQIQAYLNSVGGAADPSALYLISSGANDSAFARNNLNATQQGAYLAAQAQSLAGEIETLFHAGARHIVVNDIMNNRAISLTYSRDLYNDLDASGIAYAKSDVHEMVQNVMDNPGTFGFTAATVTTTDPALIEPDPNAGDNDQTGYGLWGANTTSAESPSVPAIDQYSFLKPPDNPQQPQLSTEETHFFADDQHLSDAGQKIQAAFDFNLISDDVIDLTTLVYDPAHSTVGFSGTSTGGVLTVSNGLQSQNITLLGNYLTARFATASDGIIAAGGTTGTLVMDTGNAQQLLLATASH